MVDAKELIDVGFSPTDAEVYLALLRNGPSTVAQMNKLVASIHRTNLYEVLERLTARDLISQRMSQGARMYVPHDPDILRYRSRECALHAQQLVDHFRTLAGPQRQPIVQVYHGEHGVQTVFNRVLREAKEVRCFNVRFRIMELMPSYGAAYFTESERRGILHKIIYAENTSRPTSRWLESKTLPEDQCGPTQVACFGDVVAFITWPPNIRVLLIEHPLVAQVYAAQFETLWSQATPVCKSKRTGGGGAHG